MHLQEMQHCANKITGLAALKERMSTEATNLTRALKGDNKKQGNWGEIILESILEKSGLEKGREYFVQQSLYNDDNRRQQPDVSSTIFVSLQSIKKTPNK